MSLSVPLIDSLPSNVWMTMVCRIDSRYRISARFSRICPLLVSISMESSPLRLTMSIDFLSSCENANHGRGLSRYDNARTSYPLIAYCGAAVMNTITTLSSRSRMRLAAAMPSISLISMSSSKIS